MAMAAVSAQESATADPGIVALKGLEEKAVAEGSREAVERLYHALIDLEQRRAEASDYTGAQRARAEADVLNEAHELIHGKPDDSPVLALEAGQARTTGAIRFDRGEDALVGWKNAGNEAVWDVNQIKPGRYAVTAHYSVGDKVQAPGNGRELRAGGVFMVRLATGLQGHKPGSFTHRVTATGGWNTFLSARCGELEIRATSATIAVRCVRAEELGIMHLRRMELRPVADLPSVGSEEIAHRFDALRRAHMREVETLLAPLEERYLEALDGLGDDPEAVGEAERLRREMAARRNAPSSGEDGSGPIVLAATDKLGTSLGGPAEVHPGGAYVTGLRGRGAYVQWDLERSRVSSGDYEVTIRFRTTERMGGQFRLLCGAERVVGRLRHRSLANVEAAFRSRRFGPLRVPPGARTLRLETVEPDVRDGMLCDLQSITLEQVALDAEHKHDDGYTEWSRATFAAGPAGNDAGDRFSVFHNGKVHHLRLYAVTCPPGNTRDARGDAFKPMRDHFRVNANDLARGGRLAAQFTGDALRSRPFTVFTKGEQSKDGLTLAHVLIDDDTLLSAALVSEGLAMISGDDAEVPGFVQPGVNAAQYRSWLQKREKEAGNNDEGVWRYSRSE